MVGTGVLKKIGRDASEPEDNRILNNKTERYWIVTYIDGH
jgi:hypothetical protein